jgi:hypothetical protein
MGADFATQLRAEHRRACGYRAIESGHYGEASSHLQHSASDYDRIGQHETARNLRTVADICFETARQLGQVCT